MVVIGCITNAVLLCQGTTNIGNFVEPKITVSATIEMLLNVTPLHIHIKQDAVKSILRWVVRSLMLIAGNLGSVSSSHEHGHNYSKT